VRSPGEAGQAQLAPVGQPARGWLGRRA